MSIRALTWALEQEHLEPVDKFVLVIIADEADENQLVIPSIEAMSLRTRSVTQDAFRQALNHLCQRDLIDLSDFTYPGFDGPLSVKLRIEEDRE